MFQLNIKFPDDYPTSWEAASCSAVVTAGHTLFIKTATSSLVNVDMAELLGVFFFIMHKINLVNNYMLPILPQLGITYNMS